MEFECGSKAGLEDRKSRVDRYQFSPHRADQESKAQGIFPRPILWRSHPMCAKIRRVQGHSPIAFFVNGKIENNLVWGQGNAGPS